MVNDDSDNVSLQSFKSAMDAPSIHSTPQGGSQHFSNEGVDKIYLSGILSPLFFLTPLVPSPSPPPIDYDLLTKQEDSVSVKSRDSANSYYSIQSESTTFESNPSDGVVVHCTEHHSTLYSCTLY